MTRASEGMGWQPIETAPKDGTRIDLWTDYFDGSDIEGRRYTDCRWTHDHQGEGWRDFGGNVLEWWEDDEDSASGRSVTHWMPLPDPPEQGK